MPLKRYGIFYGTENVYLYQTKLIMEKNKSNSAKSTPAKTVPTGNQALITPAPSNDEGTKTVNVGLSESNKMQPEAGIQAITPAGATETVIKTDPYNPQKTAEQEVLKDGKDGYISKVKHDALLGAFNQVLEAGNMDVVLKEHYRRLAGVK